MNTDGRRVTYEASKSRKSLASSCRSYRGSQYSMYDYRSGGAMTTESPFLGADGMVVKTGRNTKDLLGLLDEAK